MLSPILRFLLKLPPPPDPKDPKAVESDGELRVGRGSSDAAEPDRKSPDGIARELLLSAAANYAELRKHACASEAA